MTLWTPGDLLRVDILLWIIGIPVLIGAMTVLLLQVRQSRRLKDNLTQLGQIKRHSIEYDLVLKAMKLGTWRIDVPTRMMTTESDYRDMSNQLAFPSQISVDDPIPWVLPYYAPRAKQDFEQLMTGRVEEFHCQYQMRMPNSTESYWMETFATVEKRDLNGLPLTIVGTSMSIDKQKEIEQALIEARNKAEESDRLKSAFLANMSHEIRTPLNAIVGFSEVLTMEQDENERQQLVDLIRQNNARLLRLFDDMVNMSKLEAGGGDISKSRFLVKDLVAEQVERYADEVRRKGLVLTIADVDSAVEVCTDRERLREIVNQYLNNALKFTERGSITVGYADEGAMLRVWVRDTGKGIPADRCDDRLFERFVKVDDFVEGTGLGLSICRSLAASLGGMVGVESKEGEGSLFWVKIKKG